MDFRQKRRTVRKEKKLERVHFRVLLGLMIFGAVYYFFLEPKTIGHDNRYSIYILGLPTILGLLAIIIYRRQFLVNKFSTNKGFILWTFMTFFYLTQGLLFSYLSFGQGAKISWDILNNRAAKQNTEEIIECQVTKFWTGIRSNNIDFLFNDRYNKFNVKYKTIKDYLDKNPNDYYIEITARKGLWNYYLVESWDIKNKKGN